MSPPPTGLDMDYDPEEDGSDQQNRDVHFAGAIMLGIGLLAFTVFLLWDAFGSGVPSKGSYRILGLWLILGFGVRVAEVAYR